MRNWYLIGNDTKPNMLGGYENQGFLDCKDDAFSESLETDIASTVILYNYDLSESQNIRAIIQGNTANTTLSSMERTILVPIGTLRSGDYIYFENEYWIVDGRPGNNKIYEKAVLKECQYKLRWQKDNGVIVERWANLTSASKYDIGENKSHVIILTTNNYTIIIPNDKDSMTIHNKRVFIDISDVPEKVFKITRNDDVLFAHGNHGGTLNLIADKTEFNRDTDNQMLRICDYVPPSHTLPPSEDGSDDETVILNGMISGNTNLKVGFSRIYTATLFDSNKNKINWNSGEYQWKISSDFTIKKKITDNKIELLVDDEELINSSFLLQIITSDNKIISEIQINITDVV